MIVIISAQDASIDSLVDQRFGRCPWLICIDREKNHWEAFQNPGASQSGGAGVAAAQFVIDHQANCVVSGDFGPHASAAFQAAKIEMRLFSQKEATVQQTLDSLKNGDLPEFH